MKRLGLLILSATFIASPAALGGGFLIYEHGATSTGMANARSASADDPSALYFNPAAITELPGLQFQLGTTLILPQTHYEAAGTPDNPRTYPSYQDGEYIQKPVNDGENSVDAISKLYTPIHLYVSYTIEEAYLSVGFGLNNPFGLGSYWPWDWDGRFMSTEIEIQTFFSQPVVAVDIARLAGFKDLFKLSIAAGYNFVYGTARLGRKTDLRVAELLSLGEVVGAEGELRMKGDATGHGWNIALYAEIPELLAVGFSLRSGVSLGFSGKASFSFNQAGQTAIDLLGMSVPEETNGHVTIDLPMSMNFGVAFLGIENLKIAADVYLALFESYDELKLTFDCVDLGTCSESLNAEPLEKDWGKSWQFSLGAEYTLLDDWTVRAGWGLVTSPVPEETYDPSLPDGLRNLVSVGGGYRGSWWGVDLAYMLAFWEGTKDNEVGAGDYANPEGKASGTYTTFSHLLALSLTAWF
jgi:long-chain fatty acid transport protein